MSADAHADPHALPVPESPGVDIRFVLSAAFGVLLLLGTTVAVFDAIYRWQVPVHTVPPLQVFPPPRVDTEEREELRQVLAKQRQQLSQYRWTNDQHTLVQIPIERAMQIIASEGANAYAPLAPASALSSPTAGAERAITPTDGKEPATLGAGSSGSANPAARRSPQENRR
jgi:hypothetical protein